MGTKFPDNIANEDLKCSEELSTDDSLVSGPISNMSGIMFTRTHWLSNVVRLLKFILFHIMTLCSTSVLIVLLLYWSYGGISLLILLHLAVLGRYCCCSYITTIITNSN
jgi:hypothetical protein